MQLEDMNDEDRRYVEDLMAWSVLKGAVYCLIGIGALWVLLELFT